MGEKAITVYAKQQEIPAEEPVVWFVSFVDYGKDYHSGWRRFFTSSGFRHCYCFSYSPAFSSWLYIDFARNATVLKHADHAYISRVLERSMKYGVTLRYIKKENGVSSSLPFFLTCANCIAIILGIKGKPLTPKGLYRAMLRSGAVTFEVKL